MSEKLLQNTNYFLKRILFKEKVIKIISKYIHTKNALTRLKLSSIIHKNVSHVS